MSGGRPEFFSRVEPTGRGNDRLMIFGSDQQRPLVAVESDGEYFNCVWTSRIPTLEAVAQVTRMCEKPTRWGWRGSGVEIVVDDAAFSYEGDQSPHPWAPRFACVAESLPVGPLSRLIAVTSVTENLPADRIEQMIREFVTPPTPPQLT